MVWPSHSSGTFYKTALKTGRRSPELPYRVRGRTVTRESGPKTEGSSARSAA